MHEYKCKILRVVDGDTVDIDIDLGFGIWVHKERVRIMGIDTPESRTRDLVEKAFGLAAKEYLKTLLPADSMKILKTEVDKKGGDKKGKFGRVLGDFFVEPTNAGPQRVTDLLIEAGHAVPYFGGSKDELLELHQYNRERLIADGKVTLPPGEDI
jgi:micrococcal nuclease